MTDPERNVVPQIIAGTTGLGPWATGPRPWALGPGSLREKRLQLA